MYKNLPQTHCSAGNWHPKCWVITDAALGNQRQALALAQHLLGWPQRHLLLNPRAPWAWFAPRRFPASRYALARSQRECLAPPWPHLAIGCGRRAALFTRYLREHSAGHCYCVQILDPRLPSHHWDTIIAPRHDQVHGDNVLTPLGSLNPVDDAWLSDARKTCPRPAMLPAPRIGVLLGGPRRGVAIDGHYAVTLARRLRQQWCQEGGSLMVVASPRTPHVVLDTLRQALTGMVGWCWGDPGDGPNPYAGVLGWAHRLVVTPDSVNMLSEACATGRVVQTLVRFPLPDRLERFHRALRQAGLLHDLGTAPVCPAPPLRETAIIARQLRQRINRSIS